MALTNRVEIPRWIMKELEFKGSQLIAYSLFYQFREYTLSIEQIADTLCMSKKAVRDVLYELRQKGYVKTVFRDKNAYWYTANMDFIPEKYR